MAADPRSLFPGKHFISAILDALDTKTEMSGLIARRYLTDTSLAELDTTRDTDTSPATGITTGT